jgi:hypothetical protein
MVNWRPGELASHPIVGCRRRSGRPLRHGV